MAWESIAGAFIKLVPFSRLQRWVYAHVLTGQYPGQFSFTVLITDLAEDTENLTHTSHLAEQIKSLGGLKVIKARCPLALNENIADMDEALRSLEDKARWLFSKYNADILIWGVCFKDGYKLRFMPRCAGIGWEQNKIISGKLDDEYKIPKHFSESLRDLLHLTILFNVRPALADTGKYIVDKMNQLVPKLDNYLQQTNDLTQEQHGEAWNSLGMALAVIGYQTGEYSELERAVSAFRRATAASPKQPYRFQNNLGVALFNLGRRETGITRLNEAEQAFKAGRLGLSPEQSLKDWVNIQNNIGSVSVVIGERSEYTSKINESIAIYQTVVDMLSKDGKSKLLAMTRNNQGNAYKTLGAIEHNTIHYESASRAYRDALSVWTLEREPLHWAAAKNNLGTVLCRIGEQNNDVLALRESIAVLNDALLVRTADNLPSFWAETQNNLGLALRCLGEREPGTKLLKDAVKAFNLALTKLTCKDSPERWSMAKNNLGITLIRLGERESNTASLETAVSVLNEALQVRTREEMPTHWANTQAILGAAYLLLSERKRSITHARLALTDLEGAREEYIKHASKGLEGVEYNIQRTHALITQLEAHQKLVLK